MLVELTLGILREDRWEKNLEKMGWNWSVTVWV